MKIPIWTQWRKDCAVRDKENARRRGFGWAMYAYYVEESELDNIKAQADGYPGEPPHEFDWGARHAISFIEEHIQLVDDMSEDIRTLSLRANTIERHTRHQCASEFEDTVKQVAERLGVEVEADTAPKRTRIVKRSLPRN